MKLAICTLIDDSHAELCQTMLYSLVKNNPTLTFEFFVFHWTDLSPQTLEPIRKIHSVNTIRIQSEDYEDCKSPAEYWRVWEYNPFYRFDIFRLGTRCDKLLYIDADTLVLKDLSEFLSLPHEFYASQIEQNTGMEFSEYSRPRFNAGVMVIDKKLLTDKSRNELIRMTEMDTWSGNQTPLNLYFQDRVTFVEQKYNLQTNQFTHDALNDAAIIHFIGHIKPGTKYMTTSYPSYCLETTSLGSLYQAWNLFNMYNREMRLYVGK